MTREEHLAWCKKRAHEYLDQGDLTNAVTSMMSNMTKHEETKFAVEGILGQLGMAAVISGDYNQVRRYIDGFN